VTTLTVTINGRSYGPRDVRDDLTMNDFLGEYLGMTGTKFGCGAAQCLSCAVIIDNPDGTNYTTPTCIVPAASFNGKSIRTVEGHAKNGELSVLQKAFVEHFSFQCGYCTAGFLNEGQVLLAGRSREDHHRSARRPPVPLHRLYQISRGRARRDSGRSRTLSRVGD
jgi:aerobic-type carbon monoxide dehydrogenase small subunit (CoxS/CutS family)